MVSNNLPAEQPPKHANFNSNYQYMMKSLKRIPLDINIDYYYNFVEPHAKASKNSVSGFVKLALMEKMYRMDHGMDDLNGKKITTEDLHTYKEYINNSLISAEKAKRKEKSEKYAAPQKEIKKLKYTEQLTEYAINHKKGFSSAEAMEMLGGAYPTVQAVIKKLCDNGVLEKTKSGKSVIYTYKKS